MKKIFAALLALLLAAMLLLGAAAEEISPEDMYSDWSQGLAYNLFDVRDADAFGEKSIGGAINVPAAEWTAYLQQVLNAGFSMMDAPVYIYGADAAESRQAAQEAAQLGFTNVRYLSSIDVWPGPFVQFTDPLADLNTQDIYGNPVTAELIRGKKLVMVNVWATYCGPCINEMPGLGKLAKEFEGEGVLILGLLSDCVDYDLTVIDKNVQLAQTIAEQTGASYPHILPNSHIMGNLLPKIEAVPTTFFLDENGHLIGQRYLGARSEDAWRTLIREMLDGMEKAE